MFSWKLKLIAAAFVAGMAVVWILQNGGSVQTRFLLATVAMPLSALLAITFLAGIVSGIFLALGLSGKRKKKK